VLPIASTQGPHPDGGHHILVAMQLPGNSLVLDQTADLKGFPREQLRQLPFLRHVGVNFPLALQKYIIHIKAFDRT